MTLPSFLAILKPSSFIMIKLCLDLLAQLWFQWYINWIGIILKQFEAGIDYI